MHLPAAGGPLRSKNIEFVCLLRNSVKSEMGWMRRYELKRLAEAKNALFINIEKAKFF